MTKIQQTFKNLERAFLSLQLAVSTPPTEARDYGGIIQAFEYTYELTWRVLKLILESNGINTPFPRIVFEQAFQSGLIEGNEVWKDIMESRNQSSHTYDQGLAQKLCEDIMSRYVFQFQKTLEKIKPFAINTPNQ